MRLRESKTPWPEEEESAVPRFESRKTVGGQVRSGQDTHRKEGRICWDPKYEETFSEQTVSPPHSDRLFA